MRIMSTPERRYRDNLAGKPVYCPECGSGQVFPAHMHNERDKTLGVIHRVVCPRCGLECAICFERLDTVGLRHGAEEWATRSYTWFLARQEQSALPPTRSPRVPTIGAPSAR
jgi:ribosomal protein S27AE